MLLLLAVGLLAAPVLCSTSEPVRASLMLNDDHTYSVRYYEEGLEIPDNQLVTGEYRNLVNQTGWGFLELESNPKFADKLQAYGAGYLEGVLTKELLYMAYQNTIVGRCDGKQDLCDRINQWLQENLLWVNQKASYHAASKEYWHQVSLFLAQMSGIAEGYEAADKGKNPITVKDILIMNVFGDLEDLESALGDADQMPSRVQGLGRCSALIRLLPDHSDLLAAHDTWNSYQSMIRLIKKYTLPYKRSLGSSVTVPGHTMSFSGYPGIIYSGDDFTIASSGLTIIETTIGNSNPDLWSKVKPQSMLEGIRSTIANRLAVDGKSWTKIFAKHNSGTYNNQWMVVDYNKFTSKDPKLADDLLWVLEQIPGYTQAADVTQVLRDQGYWPSYNSPYFKKVFNMSGNPKLVEKYGDWFSYENTPRAKIFRRDVGKVTDVDGMIKLMRYNNFKQDPLSACDCTPPFTGENAISARNDLNPRNGTYPFPALGHRSHGGTDMKMTTSNLAGTYQLIAQGGPTFDPLPPFRWSEQDFKDTPHVGHPDLWQFQPVIVAWNKQ